MTNWTDYLAPGSMLALLGLIGTWAATSFNRKNSQDTLLLASRDSHIDDLRESLKDTNDRLASIERTVTEQSQQIADLQRQETGLRRYVIRLKDFIRGLGQEPPEPPPGLTL